MSNNKIVTIAGNRPEVIKLSGLIRILRQGFDHAFLYSGQHNSSNMKDVFFEEFDVVPDYDIRADTSDIFIMSIKLYEKLKEIRPRMVIVYGDTNTTVAGTIATRKLPNCKLVHVEAGLRSFDWTMQEEKNRMYIDTQSDYLLAPTDLSELFLKYEGINRGVFVPGNLIADVSRRLFPMARFDRRDIPTKFILLTLHRAENVDNSLTLSNLISFVSEINYPIIFPVHPRTKMNLKRFNLKLPSNVIEISPLSYVEFLGLLKNCLMVMTDSGGLQEESMIMKKPCITLRHTTERWETVLAGANRLYPLFISNQKFSLSDTVDEMLHTAIGLHPYGDKVEDKVVNHICDFMKEITST